MSQHARRRTASRSCWLTRSCFVVALALLPACFGGSLGSPCAGESECPFGLACFTPSGASSGICTVGCTPSACAEGVCLATSSGSACAKSCVTGADCAGEAHCQKSSTVSGCWPNDPKLTPVKEGLVVTKVEVKNASNQTVTGLKRGQTSVISLTITNATKATVAQIRSAASCSATCEKLTLAVCQAATSANNNACTINTASGVGARCTCDPVTASRADDFYQTLATGASSNPALFNIRVALAADSATTPVRFDVTFTDSASKTYSDSFTVEVLP